MHIIIVIHINVDSRLLKPSEAKVPWPDRFPYPTYPIDLAIKNRNQVEGI